ncbi:MAG: Ig-like domain-containing protein [Deltaproteobacteria bacterium]|nr:Ig-like domain-containing protein [Deltaproteobacteria bacterium]
MRVLATLLLVLPLLAACDKKPASLSLEPRELLPFEKKGKTVQLKAQTKDDRGIFLATVTPAYESSDPSVASVDDKGVITAEGTGKADIKATFEGVSASVPVTVKIVGSVEIEPSEPQKLRMGKTMKVKVTVKDDRGNVLPGEKFVFKTSGYTIDPDPDGTIAGVAVGEATLIAISQNKEARLKFDVTE